MKILSEARTATISSKINIKLSHEDMTCVFVGCAKIILVTALKCDTRSIMLTT